MPALLTLDVSHTDVTDEDLINAASFCPNLKHFRMSGCSDVTDAGVIALATHCAKLASLDLSADVNGTHPMQITIASLTQIVQRCPDVAKMHLTYSTRNGITKRGLIELNDWRIANQGKMITFNLNDEVVLSN
jgi:hypothetical protein